MAAIPYSPTMTALQELDSYKFMKRRINNTVRQVEAAARDLDNLLFLKFNYENSVSNYNLIYKATLDKYAAAGATDIKQVLNDPAVKGAVELVNSFESQYKPRKDQLDAVSKKYNDSLVALNKEYNALKNSAATGGGGSSGVPADIAALQSELANIRTQIPATEAQIRQMDRAINGRATRNLSKKEMESLNNELKSLKSMLATMKARQTEILNKLKSYGATIPTPQVVGSAQPSGNAAPISQAVVNSTNPAPAPPAPKPAPQVKARTNPPRPPRPPRPRRR